MPEQKAASSWSTGKGRTEQAFGGTLTAERLHHFYTANGHNLSFFEIFFNRKDPKVGAEFAKVFPLRTFASSLRTLRLKDAIYTRAE